MGAFSLNPVLYVSKIAKQSKLKDWMTPHLSLPVLCNASCQDLRSHGYTCHASRFDRVKFPTYQFDSDKIERGRLTDSKPERKVIELRLIRQVDRKKL